MERPSRYLQDNMLALLIWDDIACKQIRADIPLHLWDRGVEEVPKAVYPYIDRYKKAPKDHIFNVLEPLLKRTDNKIHDYYRRMILALQGQHASINVNYVLDKLRLFLKQQKLKSAIVEAGSLLQSGASEFDALEKAESALTTAIRQSADAMDLGLFMGDVPRALKFLRTQEDPTYHITTGIKEIDDRHLGPRRKTMHLFMAPMKRGKSWWAISVGKAALMAHLRVLHITLELSEEETAQRYLQALYALPKDAGVYAYYKFYRRTDDDGALKLRKLKSIDVEFGWGLRDTDKAYEQLVRKMNKTKRYEAQLDNLVIREFPTRNLTFNGLEAYFEMLIDRGHFHPDLVIIDYPDIMSLSGYTKDRRLALGELYADLRGHCVKNDYALLVLSQSQRSTLDAKTISEGNVAESIDKVAIADTVFTYQQTPAEKKLGLARMLAAVSRSEQDRLTLLMSQSYATGQFCRSAHVMREYDFEVLDSQIDAKTRAMSK